MFNKKYVVKEIEDFYSLTTIKKIYFFLPAN